MGRQTVDALAPQFDVALVWLEFATDQMEQSGFARAVGPNDGHPLAGHHVQVHALNHLGVAKAFVHAAQRQRRRHGFAPLGTHAI